MQEKMQFTLFVRLPATKDVYTLRNVQHGTTIREIRCRLELEAGFPAQIYRLHSSDGHYMHEEHCLLLDQNVWDGFVLRAQLFESWVELYNDVINDRIDQVMNNGAVRTGDNMAVDKTERQQLESIIKERGSVALYIAAFRGLFGMCCTLIQAGIDPNHRTPFGRTPLYSAVSRDNDAIVDLLIQSAADIEVRDIKGDTPLLFSKRIGAKICFRRLRLYSLDKHGLRSLKPINGVLQNISVNMPTERKLKVKFGEAPFKQLPRPPTSQKQNSKHRYSQQVAVTDAGKSVHPKGNPESETPSVQCFIWDIDDKTKRYNTGEITASKDAHMRTKSAKHMVRWKDDPICAEINATQRGKSAAPMPILKYKSNGDNVAKRSNLIRTLSRESLDSNSSTIKSESAPSQPDSELTLVSAPGDVSRLNTSDSRSVESAPAASTQAKMASAKVSRHKGSVRLLPFRSTNNERTMSAKRHIRLAEKQKEKSKQLKNAETFEQWLERKRLQECRERLTSQSEDSSHESDSDCGNSAAFDQWMKTHSRQKAQHHMTVEDLYKLRNRPLQGIVMVGTTQIADTKPPSQEQPAVSDMKAYEKWHRKQKQRTPKNPNVDVDVLKSRLERKRQKLLAAAITYEDWLEHAEQKKLLMQRILKADLKELERIEEETLIKRSPRQISFERWNSSVFKRELTSRQKEKSTDLTETKVRNSSSVTHEVWLEKKRQSMKLKPPKEKQGAQSPRTKEEKDAEFASWVRQKQLRESADLQEGRELLNALKHKRQELSVPSKS